MTLLARACNWIGNLTGTIILTPHPTAVGNCAEQVHFGLLKAIREKRKLLLVMPFELPGPLRFRLANVELGAIESDYCVRSADSVLLVLARVVITACFGIARAVDFVVSRLSRFNIPVRYTIPGIGSETLWQPEEAVPDMDWDTVSAYDWRTQFQTPVRVWLRAEKRSAAQSERVRLGLPENAWYVCLHVRESGFYNDDAVDRNADIRNYLPAIQEITDRGGWVVRMGDASMTRLPRMKQVIDYPFTASKSAAMDIYLISECAAYIGMQSGIFDIAVLFQRPIILTNMATWISAFPPKPGDIGVLKHVYCKSAGRFLSVREWLDRGWEALTFVLTIDEDYVLYENSPEELVTTVREFFDRGADTPPSPLQREFTKYRIARGRELLSGSITPANHALDMHQRYRLASRLDSTVGMISDAYLRANWECDSRAAAAAYHGETRNRLVDA